MQVMRCHACLWHCLRAVVRRAPLAPSNALVRRAQIQRPPSRALALALQRRRDYATEAYRQPDAFDEQIEREDAAKADSRSRPFRERQRDLYHPSRFRQDLRDDMRKSTVDPGHRELSSTAKRRLKMELEWTGNDPLKLADMVQKRLSKGDVQPVMDLVRFASNSMDCVVSWNHMIDHLMNTGHPNQALKVYNEMKKRAQKPDSYTYLIVLRGLGNHAHAPSTMGNALAVYHSMSAPNSRVPPTTMHTNATLRVCSRANDMDALWGIAAKLPEKGPGAADAITYTTVLGAIRQEALSAPAGMSADETAQKREAAIVEGRRLWEDIVTKWRSGDLIIDESLVCNMGQLLLIGQRPRDWDDVLSLFEQTMDIPRLVRHLGVDRQAPGWLPNTPPSMKTEDSAEIDPTDNTRRGGEFDPVELGRTVGRGRRNMAYAKPGNHSLSLILESCLKMNARKAADDYWSLLTGQDSWGIVPDEASLHMFLRVLRQARSSASVVEFLENEFGTRMGLKKAKTFRLAMSTCVRDKRNPNVFDHANVILQMMGTTLVDPDTRTLVMYTKLLTSLTRPDQVLSGLGRLGPHISNVRSMLNFGKDHARWPVAPEDRQAGIEFLSGIVSCCDSLLRPGEVSQEHHSMLMTQKARIQAYITRTTRREKEKRLGTD
ncbi:pentatricopeptide repeat protein [Diplodia corticola]|uniref:Pentatricopeptide repeat protein n=1 Tax=Diplodia corticola TaxID=236234 RepID=A0A1J9RH34_9PEZI|nr:pentatricopeptide repeat protein [Diplodia corticola]OJD39737.1 pentatricopeptide repeat protein [Diplodia corticola]